MERRSRSRFWPLDDVHANCVAVDTPDNQTLQRTTVQSSRPTTCLYLHPIYYIPAKWILFCTRRRLIFSLFWSPSVSLVDSCKFWTYLVLIYIKFTNIDHYFKNLLTINFKKNSDSPVFKTINVVSRTNPCYYITES